MWTTTLTVGDGATGGAGRPVQAGEIEARELNAIAAVLEALAVRLSPAFGAAEIADLRIAGYRFRWSGGDAGALAVADHDFHSRLVERCGDERLLDLLGPVREAIYRWQTRRDPDRAEVARAAREHDAIVDALARGDQGTAADLARAHVAGGLRGLLDVAQAHPAGPNAASP